MNVIFNLVDVVVVVVDDDLRYSKLGPTLTGRLRLRLRLRGRGTLDKTNERTKSLSAESKKKLHLYIE